eukprot:14959242-Heterocapsa_arctica.AAC.1
MSSMWASGCPAASAPSAQPVEVRTRVLAVARLRVRWRPRRPARSPTHVRAPAAPRGCTGAHSSAAPRRSGVGTRPCRG